jgi:TolA-binding protein
MTLSEKIAVATLIVTIIGIFAAWLRPSVDPLHRVVASMVLVILGGIAVWLGATISGANSEPAATATQTTPTETAPMTTRSTTKTPTYQAPPEPPKDTTATRNSDRSAAIEVLPPLSRNPLPEKAIIEPDKASSPSAEERGLAIEQQRKQALAFSVQREWPKAVEAWRQFIHNYSGHDRAADHAAYYNLGVAHEALHNWNEAADALERAWQTDDRKRDTKNLLRLGRCYAKLERWTDSVAMYEEVLRIEPGNAVAKKSLLWAMKQEPRKE